MTLLLAGFALGVVSSLHCVVMCGPLLLAWRYGAPGSSGLASAVRYHGGRLGMYAVLGGVAGAAGGVGATFGAAGRVSIVAGSVLLLLAAMQLGSRALAPRASWLGPQLGRALRFVNGHAQSHPRLAAVGAGAINGLLPCGLVYAALLTASAAGTPVLAAATMLAFGAGTTPALLTVWLSTARVQRKAPRRATFAMPLAMVAAALLLIARGATSPHLHDPQPRTETHVHR